MARLTPIRLALMQDDRTQAWLAEQAGVSRPEMSRIVGGFVPGDDVVEKVCQALGRHASVLFPHATASDQAAAPSTPSSGLAA
jgi:transcriptional regulator with XRE-family HTH domain